MSALQTNPPRLPEATLRDQERSSASKKEERQATIAADGAVIPVIYGRQRVGAKIFAVAVYDSHLYLGCLWGVGPIEAIETVTVNDKTVSGGTWGSSNYKTDYLGSAAQTADPWLATAIPGYADTLVLTIGGVQVPMAYSVVKMRRSDEGFPRVEAIIQGRKVYDPRDTSTAYSRNPALCLADWITNPVYGQGLAVDWTSVGGVADDCDEEVTTGHARRELDLVIDTDLPVAEWADILRTYAGCLIGHDGSNVKLISDRPASATRALTMSDIVSGSMRLRRLSTRDRPTVYEAQFTDTAVTPWRTGTVQAKATGVDTGTLPRRIETVTLPGITRRAQAYREAVERLNAATLTDLEAEWQTFDEGAADLIGDVVTITHDIGLTAEPFRISDVRVAKPGRYVVQAQQYSASVYSDDVSPPAGGDYTDLPDPWDIPVLSGLAGASGSSYLLKHSDGTIISRIYVTWTEPTYPYAKLVEVQFKRQSDSVWQTASTIATDDAMCAPVEDGVTYDLRARIRNSLGLAGDWATATHVVVGKTEPPPDVDTFNVTAYGDGTRLLTWSMTSKPVDLAGYQIRYTSGSSGTWASMTPFHSGLLTASPLESNALAAGTWTFAVKALDTSGNESTNAVFINGVVLPDPRLAGVLDYLDAWEDGWSGTKTNCWVAAPSGFLVATDQNDWSDLSGTAWSAWTAWAQDANDMTYTTATFDQGISTTYTPLVSASAPEGTLTLEERYHDTDISSGTWAAVGSAPITARYYQARATVTGSAGDQLRLENMTVILNADPLEEAVEDLDTSSLSGDANRYIAAGNVRIPLNESFATIRTVFITLQNVGSGWTWELIDKQTTYGPQIKIYNSSGTLANATIDVLVRGL